jgi:hypothetical protein
MYTPKQRRAMQFAEEAEAREKRQHAESWRAILGTDNENGPAPRFVPKEGERVGAEHDELLQAFASRLPDGRRVLGATVVPSEALEAADVMEDALHLHVGVETIAHNPDLAAAFEYDPHDAPPPIPCVVMPATIADSLGTFALDADAAYPDLMTPANVATVARMTDGAADATRELTATVRAQANLVAIGPDLRARFAAFSTDEAALVDALVHWRAGHAAAAEERLKHLLLVDMDPAARALADELAAAAKGPPAVPTFQLFYLPGHLVTYVSGVRVGQVGALRVRFGNVRYNARAAVIAVAAALRHGLFGLGKFPAVVAPTAAINAPETVLEYNTVMSTTKDGEMTVYARWTTRDACPRHLRQRDYREARALQERIDTMS